MKLNPVSCFSKGIYKEIERWCCKTIEINNQGLFVGALFFSLISGLFIAAIAIFVSYVNARALRTRGDLYLTIRLGELRQSFGLNIDENDLEKYREDRRIAGERADKTAWIAPSLSLLSLLFFLIGALLFVWTAIYWSARCLASPLSSIQNGDSIFHT